MVALKLVLYFVTYPIRLFDLIRVVIWQEFDNAQDYNPGWLQVVKPQASPMIPQMYSALGDDPDFKAMIPLAGFPDHTCLRTGELVDIGFIGRPVLEHFVAPWGELSRSLHGLKDHECPPVSGDMLCGWLLGYTSPYAHGPKPREALVALTDWFRKNNEGPTERMDCGFRRNPLLVGAQALLPLALYWTTWRETGDRKYLKRYLFLGAVMGYWGLCLVPTAFLHTYPQWLRDFAGRLNIKLPHNPRSLYNDANCMRCLAVLQRQTDGLHRLFYRICALIVWSMSRNWHLAFMDYHGLGFVRASTKSYVRRMVPNDGPDPEQFGKAPVPFPKMGESWEDERYVNGRGNPDSIGPLVEWTYAQF